MKAGLETVLFLAGKIRNGTAFWAFVNPSDRRQEIIVQPAEKAWKKALDWIDVLSNSVLWGEFMHLDESGFPCLSNISHLGG